MSQSTSTLLQPRAIRVARWKKLPTEFMADIPFISNIPIYGFFCCLGLLSALLFSWHYRAKNLNVAGEDFLAASATLTASGFIGAHLFWMLFSASHIEQMDISKWFNLFSGSSSTGGIIGVILGSEIIVYLTRSPRMRFYGPAFESGVICLAVTRIGCTFACEHFSTGPYQHNLALYEALFLFALLLPNIYRHRFSQHFQHVPWSFLGLIVFRAGTAFLKNDHAIFTALLILIFSITVYLTFKAKNLWARTEGL